MVVLAGDPGLRPVGMERELLERGFLMSQVGVSDSIPERASILLHILSKADIDSVDAVMAGYLNSRRNGTLVLVLIAEGTPADLVHAVRAGADDAILLPGEAAHVVARVQARMLAPHPSGPEASEADLKLSEVIQAVALELSRDEMLRSLVRSLAEALRLSSVSAVLHHPGAASGRLIATSEAPKARDLEVTMQQWPEVAAAAQAGQTFFLHDIATSPLFLGVDSRIPGGIPTSDPISSAAIPLYSMGRPFGTLVLRVHQGGTPLRMDQVVFAERVVAAAAQLIDADERRSVIARRQAMASHVDPLTGCGTLDALDRRIRDEFERSRRYGVTFAMVLLDVDSMHSINEMIGRDGGHRVLAELGRLFQRELRGPDFVARYGGEEFLFLLPETNREGGKRLVHRIRERLAESQLIDLPADFQFGLTAGVVTYPHPDVHKPEDLFARVEAALFSGMADQLERIGVMD